MNYVTFSVLREFFKLRLEYSSRRKVHILNFSFAMMMFKCKLPHQLNYVVQAVMLKNIGKELLKPKNQVRFILAVISGDIIVNNRKRAELFQELKQKKYDPFPKKKPTAEPVAVGSTEVDEENDDGPAEAAASDYEYLLAMSIGTLTMEKVKELIAQQNKVEADLEILRNTEPKTLWLRDLDALEKELDVSSVSLYCYVFFFLLSRFCLTSCVSLLFSLTDFDTGA